MKIAARLLPRVLAGPDMFLVFRYLFSRSLGLVAWPQDEETLGQMRSSTPFHLWYHIPVYVYQVVYDV